MTTVYIPILGAIALSHLLITLVTVFILYWIMQIVRIIK